MSAPKVTRDDAVVREWVRKGLTTQDMIEANFQLTGLRPSASAISQRLKELGLSKEKKEYPQAVPWYVQEPHNNEHHLKMLQAQGAVSVGNVIIEKTYKNLLSWERQRLAQRNVVAYDPIEGFSLVDRELSDGDLFVRLPANPRPNKLPRPTVADAWRRMHNGGIQEQPPADPALVIRFSDTG